MNYFDNLYTLVEIAINNNVDPKRFSNLGYYLNRKDLEGIKQNFPELRKFLPYCKWYVIQDKNMLAMSAYTYDLYKSTGLLPDLENVDINPDTEKLEHWQYINPFVFEINPETQFDFAKDIYKNCDIWNLFLAGCARMDYYEGRKTDLEQRIKYAIVEYMLRRPQFFTTEDFVDNPILHKKYKKGKREEKENE